MTRREKIAGFIAAAGADGVILTSVTNIRYALGARAEGVVFITAEGAGYCLTDSRYTELVETTVSDRAYKVVTRGDRNYPAQIKELCALHGVKRLAYESNTISHHDFTAYSSACGCEMVELPEGLLPLRAIKEQSEIESLIKAQRIAEAGFEEVLNFIRPGVTDVEIGAFLNYEMGKRGNESGFMMSLAGSVTSMPHGAACGVKVKEGTFVMLDFGATVDGYCSDMTRTVAVGYATDEMVSVYEAVKEANRRAFLKMNPGVTGKEIHEAAFSAIVERGYDSVGFTHGLGHGVGLDIHEAPAASLRGTEPFAYGMVCTDEPGIYIPGSFGVRIEDMIWLSPEGKKCLTLTTRDLIVLK